MKLGIALRWVFGIVAIIGVVKCTLDSQDRPAAPPRPPPSAEETKANQEFGVAVLIAKKIKAAMKNPDSFKLESLLLFPGGSACYEYRGTNSFNAVVPGRAVFVVESVKVLTQEANGSAFVKAWNSLCTQPGGRERASGVNTLGLI